MRPSQLVLIGHPVAHSLSPVFQQAALDQLGIPLRYERADVPPDQLAAALKAQRDSEGAGNITIPHKQAALSLCDQVTPLAAMVGAVNTFWTDADGRLHGDNTDVGGFEAASRALLGRDLAGLRVLLIGAGGAAQAVRVAVAGWRDATLTVTARRIERAEAFVAGLGTRGRAVAYVPSALASALEDCDLVVNATPLGLEREAGLPLDPALLNPRHSVLDLTYRRGAPTPWVAACRARGLRANDGLRMLVEQGALAFERWFGVPAPRDVMLAALGLRS